MELTRKSSVRLTQYPDVVSAQLRHGFTCLKSLDWASFTCAFLRDLKLNSRRYLKKLPWPARSSFSANIRRLYSNGSLRTRILSYFKANYMPPITLVIDY